MDLHKLTLGDLQPFPPLAAELLLTPMQPQMRAMEDGLVQQRQGQNQLMICSTGCMPPHVHGQLLPLYQDIAPGQDEPHPFPGHQERTSPTNTALYFLSVEQTP